ncbi:MAG: DinB family protein [Candidatus Zixiibacteriota bacterium]|nr:MAG: DinB family protein [candidate division Zixibacteria bacterium]
MSDKELRQHLLSMLTKPNAHLTFQEAVIDFPPEHYGALVDGCAHTAWQLLEHLRIAQWDILEFSRDSGHVSPKFPDGYWPEKAAPPDGEAWRKSVAQFKNDLRQMCDLISDGANDLFAKIPHGDGQTLLREALVLAKHNSYHMGQLVMLKKALKRLK